MLTFLFIAASLSASTTTALVPAAQERVELSVTRVATSETSFADLASSTKGDRLFSVDVRGVVSEWDPTKGDGNSEPLWKSEPHTMASMASGQTRFQLAVGKKLGGRIGMSPIPSFDRVSLEDGSTASAMGLNIGNNDLSALNATAAIAIDPKDKWVWIGASHGVGRLAGKGGSGWSQRGIQNGGVTCLTIGPKAKEVAIGGEDGTIRFVGSASCDVKEDDILIGHKSPIEAVAWHPKGKILASTSGTSEIIFHNRRSGKVDRTLEAKDAKLAEIAFHPKGKWIAASSMEGELFVWDLDKDELVGQVSRAKGRKSFAALVIWGKGDALLAVSGKEILRIDVESLGK